MTAQASALAPVSQQSRDWRAPEFRREAFIDFYEFHLRHRAHPGCVYYLLPYLAERYDWTPEERLWFAFLNGNTQNPVTSLQLFRHGSRPDQASEVLTYFEATRRELAWDTDRRYHRRVFGGAMMSYLQLTGGDQVDFWQRVSAGGWSAVWAAANRISSFGRLSAFSYAEYVRIMDVAGADFDCSDLLLYDKSGSRSHRNGLAIVGGRDDLYWHASNPGFDGIYTRDEMYYLVDLGASLLRETAKRAAGEAWARDVSYFTLESALCTYKSWHRPNRRYPNVYNDMLYDRIRKAEQRFPEQDFSVFWEARQACLPKYLRLEDEPYDPGCRPQKQNHYRLTGEVIMMERDYPKYVNGFRDAVEQGLWGRRPS